MVKSKPHHSRHIWTSIIAITGVSLLVIGGLGIYDYFHRTQTGLSIPDPRQTVTTTTDVSEKKPASNNEYMVAADQPRIVKIPSLNIDAYVQRVGVTADGAMATPNNIYFTGWYTGSVAPGNAGVSIINGHAGGRYNKGVFRDLSRLKSNDIISVQMGDLSWREFSAMSVDTYPLAAATDALFKDDPAIDKELHLITCDGVFNDKTQTYDERTIVVAKRVD